MDKIQSGAKRLAEEVLQMGHDGIIAIAGTGKERHITVVALERAATVLPSPYRKPRLYVAA